MAAHSSGAVRGKQVFCNVCEVTLPSGEGGCEKMRIERDILKRLLGHGSFTICFGPPD